MLEFSRMNLYRDHRVALAILLSVLLYVSIYYIENIQNVLTTHQFACGASPVTGDVQLCTTFLEWFAQVTFNLFVTPFAVFVFPLAIFVFSVVIYFAMTFARVVQRKMTS